MRRLLDGGATYAAGVDLGDVGDRRGEAGKSELPTCRPVSDQSTLSVPFMRIGRAMLK